MERKKEAKKNKTETINGFTALWNIVEGQAVLQMKNTIIFDAQKE